MATCFFFLQKLQSSACPQSTGTVHVAVKVATAHRAPEIAATGFASVGSPNSVFIAESQTGEPRTVTTRRLTRTALQRLWIGRGSPDKERVHCCFPLYFRSAISCRPSAAGLLIGFYQAYPGRARSSSRQFGLTSAEAGHRLVFGQGL